MTAASGTKGVLEGSEGEANNLVLGMEEGAKSLVVRVGDTFSP